MGDKFAVKTSQVDRFLAILVRKAKKVPPSSRFIVISEDPDDNIVLNTTYTGKQST